MNKILLTTVALTSSIIASEKWDPAVKSWQNHNAREYVYNNYLPSNWQESFETKIGTIEHNYNDITIKGTMLAPRGWLTARCIAISVPDFNGVPLNNQLSISVQMTREQFIAALKKSGIY
jgi:hypothetical protein